MESIVRKLESGIIKGIMYLPEDKKAMTHVRPVVDDIWNGAIEFNNRIFWIYKVKPDSKKTIKNVISDFLKSDIVTKDDIICTQAGTMGDMNPAAFVKEGLEFIAKERTILEECEFVNPIFNRRASKSYGNSEIFIYKNDACTSFLDKNVGSDKLVNRF